MEVSLEPVLGEGGASRSPEAPRDSTQAAERAWLSENTEWQSGADLFAGEVREGKMVFRK